MLAPAPIEPIRAAPPVLIGVGSVAWTGDRSVVYTTLLGSCIAVCLHDDVAHKGGMLHFLLAKAPAQGSGDTRYGDVALPLLLHNLLRVGCQLERMTAVVAGGADVLSNLTPIGTENTQFALAWLREQGLQITKKDLGGKEARRVRFVPSTGTVSISVVNAPSSSVSG
ncbi:MAG: chemotaxis protein CheD [Parvularcula sp.]|jgi:chemotaxis protein CheD|nr:chemotaxis protein CheD [Parvularcula sp.]